MGHLQEIWDGPLWQINATTHLVDVSSSEGRPNQAVPFLTAPKPREARKQEIDKMMADKTDRARANRVGLADRNCPKEQRKLTVFVDYHQVNAVTSRDSYPLPRLAEHIEFLGGAKIFSTVDA